MDDSFRKPDFLIIGAQKAGTTWLWEKLSEHTGTTLPDEKEIHFFGSSELYKRGPEWYFAKFAGIDSRAVTGEASTTYLSDRPAFFYNQVNKLEYDESLPLLPEMIHTMLPKVKVVVCLRDPVRRAVSAYFHWMRQGKFPVSAGIEQTAANNPRLRLIEMGDYERHLGAWLRVFPREQILILGFETDIIKDPISGIRKLYDFVGLAADFVPRHENQIVHKSWNWTRIVANYYAGPLRRIVNSYPVAGLLDRHDFLRRFAVSGEDVKFLRRIYLPQREALRDMAGDIVDLWHYGEDLTA